MLLPAFLSALPLLAVSPHTGHEITSVDREFVQQAMKGNEEEIISGQSEIDSSNADVRKYSQTIMRDHAKSGAQLEALAKQYNLNYPTPGPVPDALPPHQYFQQEITDHQKAIALYENEIKHGGNTALKQYAINTLPHLKSHLSLAQKYVASTH